jgi:hypothetical protein
MVRVIGDVLGRVEVHAGAPFDRRRRVRVGSGFTTRMVRPVAGTAEAAFPEAASGRRVWSVPG